MGSVCREPLGWIFCNLTPLTDTGLGHLWGDLGCAVRHDSGVGMDFLGADGLGGLGWRELGLPDFFVYSRRLEVGGWWATTLRTSGRDRH